MKTIDNLTIKELKKVFNKNQELRHDVFKCALDDSVFWINEYLNCFDRGAIDCNIGYPGDYISINDNEKFIDGLKTMIKTFGFFNEQDEKNIDYCGQLIKKYDLVYYYNDDKNAARLENRINEYIKYFKDYLFKRLKDEYNYYFDDENLIDYFINFYIDNFNDKYYIDDDYILYEHIEYNKCYV